MQVAFKGTETFALPINVKPRRFALMPRHAALGNPRQPQAAPGSSRQPQATGSQAARQPGSNARPGKASPAQPSKIWFILTELC